MRFYTNTHHHYCGIDLHAKTMYVCILDREVRVSDRREHPFRSILNSDFGDRERSFRAS